MIGLKEGSTGICVCMCVCVCVCVYICMHTYIYICVCVCVYAGQVNNLSPGKAALGLAKSEH